MRDVHSRCAKYRKDRRESWGIKSTCTPRQHGKFFLQISRGVPDICVPNTVYIITYRKDAVNGFCGR